MTLHLAFAFGMIALAFPPVRWVLKKLVPAPGQGPSKETASKEAFEFRAVATADRNVADPDKAFGRLRYEGSIYYLTGLFLAEAAMVLLKEKSLTKRLGGGCLTPAVLGQPFIERLTDAGVEFDVEILPD